MADSNDCYKLFNLTISSRLQYSDERNENCLFVYTYYTIYLNSHACVLRHVSRRLYGLKLTRSNNKNLESWPRACASFCAIFIHGINQLSTSTSKSIVPLSLIISQRGAHLSDGVTDLAEPVFNVRQHSVNVDKSFYDI